MLIMLLMTNIAPAYFLLLAQYVVNAWCQVILFSEKKKFPKFQRLEHAIIYLNVLLFFYVLDVYLFSFVFGLDSVFHMRACLSVMYFWRNGYQTIYL